MKNEDLKPFLKKKIKLTLKTGFHYTCTIEFLGEDSIHIVDKFNQRHVFDISQIAEVSEQNGQ